MIVKIECLTLCFQKCYVVYFTRDICRYLTLRIKTDGLQRKLVPFCGLQPQNNRTERTIQSWFIIFLVIPNNAK